MSAWGGSWAGSWNGAWGSIGAIVPVVPPPPPRTTDGGGSSGGKRHGEVFAHEAYAKVVQAERAKDARRKRRAEDRLRELFDEEWRRLVTHEPEVAEELEKVLEPVAKPSQKEPDQATKYDFGKLARDLSLVREALDAYTQARERTEARAEALRLEEAHEGDDEEVLLLIL